MTKTQLQCYLAPGIVSGLLTRHFRTLISRKASPEALLLALCFALSSVTQVSSQTPIDS